MTTAPTGAQPPLQRPHSILIVVEGLTEAVARGLPGLAAAIGGGSFSNLAPPLTGSRVAAQGTAMTGTWPDQHGLLLPVVPTETGRRSVEAADRDRPAAWELLASHGVPGIAVGWPATAGTPGGPALVTVDALFGAGMQRDHAARLISPSYEAGSLADAWMTADEMDREALSSLVPDWGQVDQDRDPRLAAVAGIVAHNVSRHAVFLELLEKRTWEFATLLLQLPADLARLEATETVGADSGKGIFTGLAERGTVLLDAFLAAILAQLPPDTRTVIAGLPDAESGRNEPGFVLMHGPGITPGARASGASLLDLAPTVFRLHGFAAPGVAGRPLVEVMQDYPLIRNFTTPWKRPDLLPSLAPAEGQASRDAAWLTRWQIIALQLRATSLMARGEWISAMPLLEKQLLLQPDSVALLMLLVECQYFAGLHREALANAWDLMDLADPADPLPVLMVAGLEAITGDFPKGRELLDEAAPLVAARPATRLFQGRVLIHLRQWQEAKTVLEALVKDEPRNAPALGQLARAHLGLSDWPAACEIALQATSLNLQDATVHEILGAALLKMGLTHEAWSAFKAATDITPSWPRPWARLAHLARQLGRGAEEIARLTARYHAAVKTSRQQRDAYLDSVKASLPGHDHAPASLSLNIRGLVAMSGTDPALLQEMATAAGAITIAGAQAEPVDSFWHPLLDAPPGRAELSLEEGPLYLMPVALPARLPEQHTYRLAVVMRPATEILADRKYLPRRLALLSADDLMEALGQERAALLELARLSPNLTLVEIPADRLENLGDFLPP